MRAVTAEGEPLIQRLGHAGRGTRLGKVSDLARCRVHHGNRLLILGLIRPITRIQQREIAAVGRSGNRHGQAVRTLRRARHRQQLLAGWQIDRRLLCTGAPYGNCK